MHTCIEQTYIYMTKSRMRATELAKDESHVLVINFILNVCVCAYGNSARDIAILI